MDEVDADLIDCRYPEELADKSFDNTGRECMAMKVVLENRYGKPTHTIPSPARSSL